MKLAAHLFVLSLGLAAAALLFLGCIQRKLLYFPTHRTAGSTPGGTPMVRWEIGGEYTGYMRSVTRPRKVWFFLHGNGGQAAQREYLLSRLKDEDMVYILEYPGYGERSGSPSRASFDAAAGKAFAWLVSRYGVEKIIVLGESLGSGPACSLANAPIPPNRIVLVVPFDVLQDVAQEHFRFIPVGLLLLDKWDNIAALKNYRGPVDIYGATYDNVIPVHHARHLAEAHPGATYHEFIGDHGWANGLGVDLSIF